MVQLRKTVSVMWPPLKKSLRPWVWTMSLPDWILLFVLSKHIKSDFTAVTVHKWCVLQDVCITCMYYIIKKEYSDDNWITNLQFQLVPLFPELVNNRVCLLHNNLHLVVLIGHLLHFLNRLLQTFLQLRVLCHQVWVFVYNSLRYRQNVMAYAFVDKK